MARHRLIVILAYVPQSDTAKPVALAQVTTPAITESVARAAIDQAHRQAMSLAGVDDGLAAISLTEAQRLEDLLPEFCATQTEAQSQQIN